MVWSVCEKNSEFMVETEEEDILGSLPCCRTSRHFTDTFLFSLCFFLYINRKTEAHVLFSPLLKNHGGYKLLLSTVKHWNLWVTTLTGLTSRGIIWLGEPEALSLKFWHSGASDWNHRRNHDVVAVTSEEFFNSPPPRSSFNRYICFIILTYIKPQCCRIL